MEAQAHLPEALEELRELERAVERESWRLHGALNAVAQMQAARSAGVVASFREMQEQARDRPAPSSDRGADRRAAES